MRRLLILLIIFGSIASQLGTGAIARFTDTDQSLNNNFSAWILNLWTQTTQADFDAGVPNNVDTSSNPGDVTIEPTFTISSWYDNNWTYRRQITIDHTKVDDVANPSTAYAEFPVLVYATGLSNIEADGADIRFTSSDGITEIPREIESYSAGTLYAWVKVTLTKDASDSTDDIIYMYYGNTSASEPAPDSAYGAQNVWTSNYVMVQHLNESSNGTADEMKDSTSKDNDGTTVGGMDFNDSVNTKIGKGLDLDGVDGAGGDHISVPHSISLNGTVDEGTWSMWINWDDWGSEQKVIMATADRYTASTDGYEWGAQAGSPDGNFFAYPWARDPNYNLNTGTNFTNGTWHYISVRYDWTSRTLTLNLDGNDLTNDILNVNATNWIQEAAIDAAWLWGGSPQRDTRFIDAQIDEIRVSDVSRSLNWITTSYNNQDNPSTFYSIGTEEEESSWYNTNWTYRRQITIDHTKVDDAIDPSITYTDFPVLVYATGLSDIEADGADIRFTSSDGITELPREIESYSAGTLYAWVKVTLTKDASDSTDDNIYMYYGNTSASEPAPDSAYGAQNVWTSNYGMVQHMQGSSYTAFYDSTNNNNNVTTEGGDPTYQQPGQIDNAVDFDGSADYVAVDDDTSLDPVNALTISGWFYFDTDIGSVRLISKEEIGSWSYRLLTLDNGVFGFNDGLLIQLSIDGSVNSLSVQINNALTLFKDEWVFLTTIYNGSTLRLYVNATQIGSNNGSISIYDSDTRLGIGASGDGGWSLNGLIDEVRVSNTAKRVEWIQTCYNNQNDPSTFCGIGTEEENINSYSSPGTLASQVFDTGVAGSTWDAISWDETLQASTDITFEVRASDTSFAKGDASPSWTSVGGTSPVNSGLPSGRYMQWRVTLTSSDTSKTSILHEVTVEFN